MKKLIILSAFVISLFALSSFTNKINLNTALNAFEFQDGLIVYASYNGYAEGGYNFITKGKDDKSYTLTFQKAKPSVLKKHDLKSDALIGTFYKITFHKDDKFSKEEHDDVNTITALEKQ